MLKSICSDMYDITGIKAVIYDGNMNCVYSHPLAMGYFCKEIRKHNELREKCIECDKYGFNRCKASGETCIYKCHMGLTEAVTPVYDNETVIGFILFGQMLENNSKSEIEKKVKKLLLDNEDNLIESLKNMESTEKRIIYASARLVSMCASYVNLKKVLNLKRESLPDHIIKYISENISDVNLKKITLEFAISKGTLYNIAKSEFNMGISEYIRSVRIKKAIALIKENLLPIYRIAEEVGISDANYLTKIIKKETGKTPRQLKKENGL